MKKILVMDDEIDICAFVKTFFEERGFQVFASTTVNDAISIAKTEMPYLVILDIKMKKDERNRNGITALKEIKKVFTESKIVMITGVEDNDVVQEAKNLGAHDYITKPLELEQLLKIVTD